MTIFGGEHMVKEIQGAGFLVYQYYSIQQDEIFVLARVDNDILTQFADTIDYRMLLDVLFVLNPQQSDGFFEILICESLVQEAVDEHHQISGSPVSLSRVSFGTQSTSRRLARFRCCCGHLHIATTAR
jgi:hypothetical protein